jgi:hypothetical protein
MFKPQSTLERLFAAVRQRRYPAEFRISEPHWPEEIAEQLSTALQRETSQSRARDVAGLADEQIVAIGTKLWRLRSEMMRQAQDQKPPALRYAYRHLDALWTQLAEAGIEVRDHTGEAVPKSGIYLLKTVAYQPVSGINRQCVIETLKPTIYFNNRIIQVGEVIVGTPKQPN